MSGTIWILAVGFALQLSVLVWQIVTDEDSLILPLSLIFGIGAASIGAQIIVRAATA